jgi:hypothetical protein
MRSEPVRPQQRLPDSLRDLVIRSTTRLRLRRSSKQRGEPPVNGINSHQPADAAALPGRLRARTSSQRLRGRLPPRAGLRSRGLGRRPTYASWRACPPPTARDQRPGGECCGVRQQGAAPMVRRRAGWRSPAPEIPAASIQKQLAQRRLARPDRSRWTARRHPALTATLQRWSGGHRRPCQQPRCHRRGVARASIPMPGALKRPGSSSGGCRFAFFDNPLAELLSGRTTPTMTGPATDHSAPQPSRHTGAETLGGAAHAIFP